MQSVNNQCKLLTKEQKLHGTFEFDCSQELTSFMKGTSGLENITIFKSLEIKFLSVFKNLVKYSLVIPLKIFKLILYRYL